MNRPLDRRPDGSPPAPAPGAIEARRTARAFDPDRPLPSDLLRRLLELATLAPSPSNLQPWRFVVVRDPRNRRRLRGCTFGDPRITEAPVVLIVLAYLHPDRTDLEPVVDRMLGLGAISVEAAARLRATATREWGRGADPTLRATRPAMLAAAHLMIAAESLGVASAWLDGFDETRVREAFGIPDDHALCGLLALGFAAEVAPYPGRFGLDHACFEEHFGRPWPRVDPPSDEIASRPFSPLPPGEGPGVRDVASPTARKSGSSVGHSTGDPPHPGPLPEGIGLYKNMPMPSFIAKSGK